MHLKACALEDILAAHLPVVGRLCCCKGMTATVCLVSQASQLVMSAALVEHFSASAMFAADAEGGHGTLCQLAVSQTCFPASYSIFG